MLRTAQCEKLVPFIDCLNRTSRILVADGQKSWTSQKSATIPICGILQAKLAQIEFTPEPVGLEPHAGSRASSSKRPGQQPALPTHNASQSPSPLRRPYPACPGSPSAACHRPFDFHGSYVLPLYSFCCPLPFPVDSATSRQTLTHHSHSFSTKLSSRSSHIRFQTNNQTPNSQNEVLRDLGPCVGRRFVRHRRRSSPTPSSSYDYSHTSCTSCRLP